VEPKFSCPMHPEIVELTPGDCDQCGMRLTVIWPKKTELLLPIDPELMKLTHRFYGCIILTIPLIILSLFHVLPFLQAVLATPVVLWGGYTFFVRGGKSLIYFQFNMFTLIALGIGAGYLYSLWAFLFPHSLPNSFNAGVMPPLYFAVVAVVTILVLLGQILELRFRSQALEPISALMKRLPHKVYRLQNERSEEEIPLESLQPGDKVRVASLGIIPCDGTVLKGNADIDESMITGEFMPSHKTVGDRVIAGTLNENGTLIIQADKLGPNTLLARITHFVVEAIHSKAPIQQLVDRVSSAFVPIVVIIAFVSFTLWLWFGSPPALPLALLIAISVLIVANPAALGLATPLSVTVAIGRAAEQGILIKNASIFEKLHQINTLVMDKTGTLTEGNPELLTLHLFGKETEEEILQLAASLETLTEHPLSNAILVAAQAQNLQLLPVSAFQSRPGKGVSGEINGKLVYVGNQNFLRDQNIREDSYQEALRLANSLQEKGQTTLFVAIENRVVACLGLGDNLKPTSKDAVDKLKKAGIHVVLLTGDNEKVAQIIANQLGISDVKAESLPQDKFQYIKDLQSMGAIVAMAGDGINDAPALATADVGIAMGGGTDLASTNAPITMVKGDLAAIEKVYALSDKTVKNIRANLLFVFAYNALGIIIATGLFYPIIGLTLSPIVAAIAMVLCTLAVASNALYLKRVEI